MLETIRLLYDYTHWADGKMLEAVSRLGPEPWTKDLGSSLKSVRDTVVHLASAQWIWLSRWKGESPKAMWSPGDFPSQASVREQWDRVRTDLASFAAAQTEESLHRPLAYRNLKGDPFSYPLGHLMLHTSNHSTYHRGQVTTLIRQLGAQPVSTDLVLYYLEKEKARPA
ncbi:MAG TPA: DinB family protein [Planctomycetota bacterium]|nr:DinB family protein [Planctomycetota bacterium]